MSNDLISRSALLEKIQFRIPNDRVLTDIVDSCVKITRRIIEEAPAVDAVPVVRCKDCKYYDFRKKAQLERCGANCLRWGCRLKMFPDGFCSYGDRKEDGI